MKLTHAIKEQAHQLGFSLVGVTTGDSLSHAQVFADWLAQGRHGEMDYLANSHSRLCRANPQKILPGCQSVLVLGAHYPTPLSANASDQSQHSLHGKVASYARGEDYHVVLPERLKKLVEFIQVKTGRPIPNRWYTDTGPILERELGMRAGLGWIGKNTCLINPHLGSYFLLAEILLGLELEPDPPFTADRCGSCTRCIQACPTGCILPDRTLDARRCISYLTIELKGSISPDLRLHMNGWVFGCDVCQQVCPWNRFATSSVDPSFDQLVASPAPDLLAELTITPQEFNRKYRHSPIRRAKRRGYLRNIAVALGNLSSRKAAESLTRLLASDPEPLVRSHSAWALGQINTAHALEALRKAALQELDPQVLQEINKALMDHP